MSINELFGTTENTNAAANRGLPGTAELTNIAAAAAHRIVKAMEADIGTYKPRIQQSAADAREMDSLIAEFGEIEVPEDSMLRFLDDETVESMLKSQQSKRSRAKSKAMTLDNYISMMTAAIAENILRDIYNKPKSASGFQRKVGTVDYTGAQLEELAADQEALRREIRNIQSKKSIMKSKAGFSEADPRWMALLKAEQQLKDLRVGGRTGSVVEVDKTRDALSDLLAGQDLSKMKPEDAQALLARVAELASQQHVVDETAAEEAE